jgi:hypothetical protein
LEATLVVDTDAELRLEIQRLTEENESLKAENDHLKAENEAIKGKQAQRRGALTLKVSEKGAVSVYGLGRFPVTLYKEQWNRLLDAAEEIRKFIAENEERLKAKE